MQWSMIAGVCVFGAFVPQVRAQLLQVAPQIQRRIQVDRRVAVLEVAARFVTTIRMPETVNAVVIGDPSLFSVEHSEKEPKLVFVKALTTKPAETNLLISTIRGREASLLLVSRGEPVPGGEAKVDFVLSYEVREGFLIAQDSFPSPLVGETVDIETGIEGASTKRTADAIQSERNPARDDLDRLLDRQERASLPQLYGQQINLEEIPGDRVKAGVSEVIDGGQRVLVLFSAVNRTKQAILLMLPQVQLASKTKKGRILKRSEWSAADQLPVLDYRLNRRRLGPGERADGVVVFERPPYKLSTETLLLQIAEAGSVNKPALAPIGFGISSLERNRK